MPLYVLAVVSEEVFLDALRWKERRKEPRPGVNRRAPMDLATSVSFFIFSNEESTTGPKRCSLSKGVFRIEV